jgi:hypothetical protein
MLISATYICPIRGLAGLEPPEPSRLGRAAGTAKSLGLERLLLPVLEEPLVGATKAKLRYLDGLILALDRVADAGLTAWLIAPAQRVLGLDWVPPHLVKGVRDRQAGAVFVDGRARHLWPFDWWAAPSLIQKRIRIFREVVAAVRGHPALTGWFILDRALEWARPEPQVADLVLKSYLAEIRERDESGSIYLGLGWSELLAPEMAQTLAGQVDGLRMSGLESPLPGMDKPKDLADELFMATYLGTLARWLFGKPTEVEIGWGLMDGARDLEEIIEAGKGLTTSGLAGAIWLNLTDPEPRLYTEPPWDVRPDLDQVGLLDQGMEPKEWVEPWLTEIQATEARAEADDFIDLSPEEYISDPHTHLSRLWGHFREWL